MTQHAEKRILRHQPEQLYALVADVAKYPEFLPWCLAARIRSKDEQALVADLIIGFQMFKERFTSHVRLDEDAKEIHVEYAEGPFKYLTNRWRFLPHEQGCEIDFYVDFEFNSRILQTVIESLFTEAVKKMVGAFETRADALYGVPDNSGISHAS
ncbi:MAG: type II toxin-antitoxin system RatA family toxin [Candidatus Puniceispirillaceae bacterium]